MFNTGKQKVLKDQPAVGKIKMCSRAEQYVMWASLMASSSRRGDGQRISVGGLLSGSKARFLSGNLCCSWNRCNWWPLDLIFDVSFSSPS